jgi:DNA invertase Pin-like site-specific DNA recombinase
MTKLPADLLADSVRPIRGGQTSCLGGIRGGTQGVRAHMGNACGLPCGSGGGRCRGNLHVTSSATTGKSAADLFGDAKLATSEGPRPGDRVTRAAVLRSFGLEQPQHPLCAIRCPHRDDPSVDFAQRLRRTHTCILPRVSPRAEVPDDLDRLLERPAFTNLGRPTSLELERPAARQRDQHKHAASHVPKVGPGKPSRFGCTSATSGTVALVELGYARVSTVKQDLDRQIDALVRVGIVRERIYVDKKSGATVDRPGLRAVLEYAREGDVIVVHTLDRLGRTVRDTLNMIHELSERGIGVRNLADPIRIDSTNPGDPMAQLAVVLLALFAQMERTYTIERAAHARAVATAKGRRVGRPVLVDRDKLEYAAHLRDQGDTIAEIVTKTGIPRTSLYRHLPPRPAPAVTADGSAAVERDGEA